MLEHASIALRRNEDVVLQAVLRNGLAPRYASKEMRENQRVARLCWKVLQGVQHNSLVWQHASQGPLVQQDPHVPHVLELLPYNLSCNADISEAGKKGRRNMPKSLSSGPLLHTRLAEAPGGFVGSSTAERRGTAECSPICFSNSAVDSQTFARETAECGCGDMRA